MGRPADAMQLAGTGKLDAMVIKEESLRLAQNHDLLLPYFSPRPDAVSGGAPPRYVLLSRPAPTPPQTGAPAPKRVTPRPGHR